MELNEAFQGADSIIGILGPELPATMGASLFDCLFPHLLTIDIGSLSINKKTYRLSPFTLGAGFEVMARLLAPRRRHQEEVSDCQSKCSLSKATHFKRFRNSLRNLPDAPAKKC